MRLSALYRFDDTLANKISFYHLLLLITSLPFDRFYTHIILISFAVHTFIQLNPERFKAAITWRTLILQSVFFVTLAATIYTNNTGEASNGLGRLLPVLIIPIIFSLSGFNFLKYRQQLLLGFSLVCTVTIIYLFLNAFFTVKHYGLPLSVLFSHAFTNHNFSEPIDMHATFFSMQLVIALVYLVTVVLKEDSLRYKIFYVLCSLVLLAGLFQLSSKSVFFCLFIIIEVVLPLLLLSGKTRIRFVLITSLLCVLAIVGIFSSKAFKERYVTELKTDLSTPTTEQTTDSRMERWTVAGKLITASPVIGHGSGTETALLHEIFYQKKYYRSFLDHLNAHNQYLSFLIQSGLIGLIIYLLTLGYGFRTAFAKRDILFISFMLLVAIVSLSEDYLDADKGVCFYAFFFSFFIFSDEINTTVLNQKRVKLI